MKKIAILGATGFIGKSLTYEFSQRNKFEVSLFSRSKDKASDFLKTIEARVKFSVHDYSEFKSHDHNVIINCSGIGNPTALKRNPSEIFKVTEYFDGLCIDYLEKNPDTLYINLSTGAVYGGETVDGITSTTKSVINMNNLSTGEYYVIAKMNSEAKHRSRSDLNIIDLRLFSFFSRFIDLDSKLLMGDIVDCLKNKKVLETSVDDIMRDYISQEDLADLIELLIQKEKMNDFFDVYTKGPISKFELLDALNAEYGLKYKINNQNSHTTPTGIKKGYYSKNYKAEALGYSPKYDSLAVIKKEIKSIFS
jgi:nucleoside-diphosphate-sugar epimerase